MIVINTGRKFVTLIKHIQKNEGLVLNVDFEIIWGNNNKPPYEFVMLTPKAKALENFLIMKFT